MKLAGLNWFDWFLIAVVAFSMVMAFRRGLVRATFGLLGFVAGFLIAAWQYPRVGDWFNTTRLIVAPSTARIVAFLLIAVTVALAFEVIGKYAQKALRTIGLDLLDRFLGMVFGFARGCLMGIGLLMLATTFAPQSQAVTTSVLSPYLFAISHDVSFLVPRSLQRVMLAGAFNLEQNPPHWINWH